MRHFLPVGCHIIADTEGSSDLKVTAWCYFIYRLCDYNIFNGSCKLKGSLFMKSGATLVLENRGPEIVYPAKRLMASHDLLNSKNPMKMVFS